MRRAMVLLFFTFVFMVCGTQKVGQKESYDIHLYCFLIMQMKTHVQGDLSSKMDLYLGNVCEKVTHLGSTLHIAKYWSKYWGATVQRSIAGPRYCTDRTRCGVMDFSHTLNGGSIVSCSVCAY